MKRFDPPPGDHIGMVRNDEDGEFVDYDDFAACQVDIEACLWAYRKLLTLGVLDNTPGNAAMADRFKLMIDLACRAEHGDPLPDRGPMPY